LFVFILMSHVDLGTTANVGICVYGYESRSGSRHLYKDGAFQRGAADVFQIATDVSLGTIYKVKIWHDNTGSLIFVLKVVISCRFYQLTSRNFTLASWFYDCVRIQYSLSVYRFNIEF